MNLQQNINRLSYWERSVFFDDLQTMVLGSYIVCGEPSVLWWEKRQQNCSWSNQNGDLNSNVLPKILEPPTPKGEYIFGKYKTLLLFKKKQFLG